MSTLVYAPNSNAFHKNISSHLGICSGDANEVVLDGDTLNVSLTGLLPFTNYSVNVSASTEAGMGPPAYLEEMTLQAGELYYII